MHCGNHTGKENDLSPLLEAFNYPNCIDYWIGQKQRTNADTATYSSEVFKTNHVLGQDEFIVKDKPLSSFRNGSV